MDVIYGLIPGMLLLGLVALGIFFWAAKSGQFEDMEGEAHRILMDDEFLPEGGKKGRSGTDPESGEDSPEKNAD